MKGDAVTTGAPLATLTAAPGLSRNARTGYPVPWSPTTACTAVKASRCVAPALGAVLRRAAVSGAKQWGTDIEAAPGAAEGIVKNLDQSWKHEDFLGSDLVVCRTTRPLIALAYQFLRARIPARVMGKDIGEGLKALVKKMNAKGIDALVEKLEAFTEREYQKLIARGSEAKAEAVKDKTDSVMCLIEGLPETDRTVPALLATIDDLFNDRRSGVTLATIHKSKGLEADRVWWLNASACPASWARQPWQKQQERNLCYVAATRAKAELVMFEERVKVKIGKRDPNGGDAAEAVADKFAA